MFNISRSTLFAVCSLLLIQANAGEVDSLDGCKSKFPNLHKSNESELADEIVESTERGTDKFLCSVGMLSELAINKGDNKSLVKLLEIPFIYKVPIGDQNQLDYLVGLAIERGLDIGKYSQALLHYYAGEYSKSEELLVGMRGEEYSDRFNLLAHMNLKGLVGKSSRKRAMNFLRKGVQLGNLKSIYLLAAELTSNVLPNNKLAIEEIDSLLNMAGERGDGRAFLVLGSIYHSDDYGLKNSQKAIEYYLKAANLGIVKSTQYDFNIYEVIAVMYFYGDGVEKNIAKSYQLVWLSKLLKENEYNKLVYDTIRKGVEQNLKEQDILKVESFMKKCALDNGAKLCVNQIIP
ncbi:tetratricopeptide repeat protein [Paraferrimonas sp. SM1919]|uniref:tetratricopeptide repeat protein n=1 Tax=Paraferrimonas sp. SM1919 TaxID=2662263 RepID=UPI0013CF6C6B|nr:tetratricopeptide repeat protein [Paraferrimonas sp. SM1919]